MRENSTTENRKKSLISSSELGRLQPQAMECESLVLGALLIEKQAFDTVSSILKPEMFYDNANETIYRAIIALEKERKPVDMITVAEKLKADGDLERIGGAYYIAKLSSGVVSSAHCEYHAQIIAQKYLAREVISITSNLQTLAFDETQDIEDVLSEAETLITSLRENSVDRSGIYHISELFSDSLELMFERIEKRENGITQGVSTGLVDLNRITSGWQGGDLIIIAARPAMGKTAFSLHFAKSAAKAGVPVAMFSLEMSRVSLSNRLLLSEADVNPDNFKSGRLSESDIEMIEKSAVVLWNYPIYVDDNPVTTISKIKSKARLLKRQNKCGMIVIDYLQLADGEDRTGNREQEIASISRGAKKLAKELNVPVMLLSQLSRKVEDRADKKPMLSDLRESGAIEQDADMVVFLYRHDYYFKQLPRDERGNEIKNHVELIIAKYREGATGSVHAVHNGSLTKIFDYDNRGYKEYSDVINYHEPRCEGMPF